MITAVDSNVLIDILGADPTFGPRSLEAARRCSHDGVLIACEAVWAEVLAAFPQQIETEAALRRIPIEFSSLGQVGATRAGVAWRDYRRRGGPRERIIADFLVGAHAMAEADRLLTRDRGFQRTAFAGLTIIDPSA